MITRIDHLQLAMPPGGEAKARAFWREVLGMIEEEKPKPLAARRWVLVSVGRRDRARGRGKRLRAAAKGASGVLCG